MFATDWVRRATVRVLAAVGWDGSRGFAFGTAMTVTGFARQSHRRSHKLLANTGSEARAQISPARL